MNRVDNNHFYCCKILLFKRLVTQRYAYPFSSRGGKDFLSRINEKLKKMFYRDDFRLCKVYNDFCIRKTLEGNVWIFLMHILQRAFLREYKTSLLLSLYY